MGLRFNECCVSSGWRSWSAPEGQTVDREADPEEGAEQGNDLRDQPFSCVRYTGERSDRDRDQSEPGDGGKPAHSARGCDKAFAEATHPAKPSIVVVRLAVEVFGDLGMGQD